MFQDFDLAIRKDYRWPTRKPVRASCIRPGPDIAGNRVGIGRLGAPSRRLYNPGSGYWGNEREVRYLSARMARTTRCPGYIGQAELVLA